MKVIVVSYHCAPEVTPRAFRATSIVDGFTKLGHEVELISPLKRSSVGAGVVGGVGRAYFSSAKSRIRKVVEKLLPGGRDLKAVPFYCKELKDKEVDLVISVGLPFSVHLSVALSRLFFGLKSKKVFFDYGDPYSANPAGSACFYAAAIETWALRQCDVILTPVEEAVPLFESVKPSSCQVEVVPQGYDINNVHVSGYRKNKVPTFGYAGILYRGIREPVDFLRYLSDKESDFCFLVHTDIENSESMNILRSFSSRMRGRLIIKPLIPRRECLSVLSEMDFLINFSNEGGVQQPSKLVDYTLAGRPYLSIASSQSCFPEFDDYFKGDYDAFEAIDISRFDQDRVADKIVGLF